MTKFLNKWLRLIHRWIAIPTALLIPVRLIMEALESQAALELWEKFEKLPSILMLFMASALSLIYLLPYIVKAQRKKRLQAAKG